MESSQVLNKIPFDRILSARNALSLLEDCFPFLIFELEVFGDDYPIYKCRLKDVRNNHIYISSGKGFGLQSKTSALYEALQHFLCFTSINKPEKISYYPPSQVPSGDYLFSNDGLPTAITNQPHRILPWLQYQSFNDDSSIYYPLPLSEFRLPRIKGFEQYLDLNWRSHEMGSAVGCTFEEAAIHGLNEWIEVDAFGLLLIKLFVKKPSEKLKLINKNTLPNELLNLCKYIEKTYQDEILIIDMTSDINVPAFTVSLTKQKTKLQPKGFGASLSKARALESAIFELLQVLMLLNDNALELQTQVMQTFEDKPIFKEAAQFDLSKFIDSNHFTQIDFNQLIDYSYINDLPKQLKFLNKLINDKGYKTFFHLHAKLENGITCLSVMIPGFEEFSLVKQGKFMLPKARGRTIVKN